MKHLFALIAAVLLALSGATALLRPGPEDERTKLVWVCDDSPVRREQVALFNAHHPDFRLVLDPQPLGMEKVVVQTLAGVGPDLFDAYSATAVVGFVRLGVARDLTDMFAESGIDPEAVWPSVRPMMALDGRLYGHASNVSAQALWYNRRLFDALGEPYPSEDWTWEDCIAAAQRFNAYDARGRQTRFGLLSDYWDWRTVFLPQSGGDLFTPEGTRCILDSEEGVAALSFYADLIFRHRVTPGVTDEMAIAGAGGWGLHAMALFGGEAGAMAIGARWWLAVFRRPDYAERLDIAAAPLPRGAEDRIYGSGRVTLASANTANIEGVRAFMEFLHGPEWNALINAQADGLGPVARYHYGEHEESYLYNPDHPEETFNETWRMSMERAIPEPMSPFVSGQIVDRILMRHIDMLRNGAKTAPEAAADAAREINARIVERLRIDPPLRERYEALLAAGARPAWDSPADAP